MDLFIINAVEMNVLMDGSIHLLISYFVIYIINFIFGDIYIYGYYALGCKRNMKILEKKIRKDLDFF